MIQVFPKDLYSTVPWHREVWMVEIIPKRRRELRRLMKFQERKSLIVIAASVTAAVDIVVGHGCTCAIADKAYQAVDTERFGSDQLISQVHRVGQVVCTVQSTVVSIE